MMHSPLKCNQIASTVHAQLRRNSCRNNMKSSAVFSVVLLLTIFTTESRSLSPNLGRLQLSSLLEHSVGTILSEFGHRTIAKRQTVYDITAQDVVDCITRTTEYQCGSSGYSQEVVDIAIGCKNDSYARKTANACARNSDGDTCGAVTLKFLSDQTNAEACSGVLASGACHSACRSFLELMRDTMGCCINAYFNTTDYPLYERYKGHVDYRLWSLCEVGTTDEVCKDSGLTLKHLDDQKSCSSQELVSRFVRYECSADVGQSLINALMKNDRCYIFSSVMVDACSSNNKGQYCAEAIGTDIISNVITDPLLVSLNSHCFPGSGCTPSCRNAIQEIKDTYDCCVNVYNDSSIGLQLPSLSYEVWEECGIETPGFCKATQTIPDKITENVDSIQTTESMENTESIQTTEDVPFTQSVPIVGTEESENTESSPTTESVQNIASTPVAEPAPIPINVERTEAPPIVVVIPGSEQTQSLPTPSTEQTENNPTQRTEFTPTSENFQTTERIQSLPPTPNSEATPGSEIIQTTDRTPNVPTTSNEVTSSSGSIPASENTQNIPTPSSEDDSSPEILQITERTPTPSSEAIPDSEIMQTTEHTQNVPTTSNEVISSSPATESMQSVPTPDIETEASSSSGNILSTDQIVTTQTVATEGTADNSQDGNDHEITPQKVPSTPSTDSVTSVPPSRSSDHSIQSTERMLSRLGPSVNALSDSALASKAFIWTIVSIAVATLFFQQL